MSLTVGQRARRSATLTAEHVRLFSQITGDYNPLHVDAEFTATTRFKKLIVQGGLTSGLLHAIVAMDLPGPGTAFNRLRHIRPPRVVLRSRVQRVAHPRHHNDASNRRSVLTAAPGNQAPIGGIRNEPEQAASRRTAGTPQSRRADPSRIESRNLRDQRTVELDTDPLEHPPSRVGIERHVLRTERIDRGRDDLDSRDGEIRRDELRHREQSGVEPIQMLPDERPHLGVGSGCVDVAPPHPPLRPAARCESSW